MRTLVLGLLVALAACAPTPSRPAPRAVESPEPGRAPAALRVDHAWVKDAPGAAEQASRRTTMERLRAKVEKGEPFVGAWNALGVDGGPWHVAEQETYAYDVIPPSARDLPVGALSPIIPGNGGLHLFRILGREYGI